jgi:hypothetical protein
MNKGQVIGLVVTGLAVVGGIAVFNYFRKPRANSEGFFNATGTSRFFQQTSDRNVDNFANAAGIIQCKRPDGSYYQEDVRRKCINGAVRVS